MFYLFTATTDSSTERTPLIEPAARQLNALQRWWSKIDWETVIGLIIQKTIAIAFYVDCQSRCYGRRTCVNQMTR